MLFRSKLPEGAQVSLEMTGESGQLLLRSGRSRFNLQALPESDFPDLSTGDLAHKFKLAAGDLKKLIDKTQFAISTEETRHYLNGIFMHATDVGGHAMLRAVATDGHRLVRFINSKFTSKDVARDVIIPAKALHLVVKSFESQQASIAFSDKIGRAHV